jgi:hypothetical protein
VQKFLNKFNKEKKMKMFYEKDTDVNLLKIKKLQFLVMEVKDMLMH